MRSVSKIGVLLLFASASMFSHAQDESHVVPLWNPVIANPGFAGFDKTTSLRTGNHYYQLNDSLTYNLFYATYDTYSEKLKGGIAFSFQQGLIGSRNINTTEAGFSYTRFPKKTKNGNIRFSAGANILLATKQWWVQTLDQTLVEPGLEPNLPGREFMRYVLFKPQMGFLWDSEAVTLGMTVTVPLKMEMASDSLETADHPAGFVLYLSRKNEGYKNGLRSKPYVLIPELIVSYHADFFVSRFKLVAQHTSHTLGAFIQNDFTNNMHALGATIGYASNYTRIDLSAGTGIPGISDEIGFCVDLALRVTIPEMDYSRINPWAVKRK
ncbi:type IX secretion system membrane protein PorP/SprF [Maribellus sp. YY47]|uniref:type IX secretion system membrane protein PorP/SprF n=1 Tax=Maribellus sp. YY47 TaxID=2929486 RepID=UPI0020018803|nr:type IX secretion system membrane protein PorP/SprF [Maribellus sp. YY47]MCK3683367.1 type IX secretion system membrane protein PorP/SprF [Maribellus sp. YY47]